MIGQRGLRRSKWRLSVPVAKKYEGELEGNDLGDPREGHGSYCGKMCTRASKLLTAFVLEQKSDLVMRLINLSYRKLLGSSSERPVN